MVFFIPVYFLVCSIHTRGEYRLHGTVICPLKKGGRSKTYCCVILVVFCAFLRKNESVDHHETA